MKVLVLGGGVIGVTTAYYLSRAGHEVVVLERHSGVAQETSFANAGQVSAGYASPWAAPGVPIKAIQWLLAKHGPLVIRPGLDPAMYGWIVRLLLNCTAARHELNRGRMLRLAEYSRDCLLKLRAQTGLAYDQECRGTLQLFRTAKQIEHAGADLAILNRFGIPARLLNLAGCIQAEPGLALVYQRVAGGILFPGDETGDCHMFTTGLAQLASHAGVRFAFNTDIIGLERSGSRIVGADAYRVDEWGPVHRGARQLLSIVLRPIGLSIPVLPVKGYSITLPITDFGAAPRSTVMDETYKVAITRLGTRIRVGGTAELAGYDMRVSRRRRRTLDFSLGELFPRATDSSRARVWCGLRPMTPDGTPIVGPTPYENLLLNTGHGTLGWTMACGSGRLIADLVSGRKPEIRTADLSVARYLR